MHPGHARSRLTRGVKHHAVDADQRPGRTIGDPRHWQARGHRDHDPIGPVRVPPRRQSTQGSASRLASTSAGRTVTSGCPRSIPVRVRSSPARPGEGSSDRRSHPPPGAETATPISPARRRGRTGGRAQAGETGTGPALGDFGATSQHPAIDFDHRAGGLALRLLIAFPFCELIVRELANELDLGFEHRFQSH